MDLDKDKIAESAMAILALTMFQDGPVHRAWKGMDWEVLDDLYERGWIHDPKGKVKSVVFTEEGHRRALECMRRLFGAGIQPTASADEPASRR